MDLHEQRAIILGCNGIGKSNLLESVEVLSQLRSSRALSDKDLIKNDSEMAVIYGQIDFTDDLKVNLFRKGSKKIYVNDSLLKKQSEIKNYIRSVCFCSNDINIVKSEPGYRRTWIDRVVSQLEPIYVELIHRFNRLLKQRSYFWRSESFQKDQSSEVIESFDIQMSLICTRIFRRRRRAISRIRPYVEYWHNHLSKSKEQISINYLSSFENIDEAEEEEEVISNQMVDQLQKQRAIEALTGKCSFGPHRDDIEFLINDISLRKYGSSGQQRTFILALKMAELDLLRNMINLPPLLILDDVLAELDMNRQNLLLNSVGKESQCFISATHLDTFNQSFISSSQMIHL
ncbi:DNA replication/repair protein RecF [Prochlorococcus marinus]|uniref:DNA replication/repair protein RecF n=1 Tax=Prochlorococcus marinus TaxID=1219 RepID=UPI0005A175F8